MPLRAIRPLFSHSLVRDLGRKPNSEPHPTRSEVGSRLTGEPSETPTRRLAWPPNHVNHDKRRDTARRSSYSGARVMSGVGASPERSSRYRVDIVVVSWAV